MDEIVLLLDDTPELVIELSELSLDIIISDIRPEATVVIEETTEPDIIEVVPDLPFYVEIFEWPACPDEPYVPPVPSIALPIGPTDVLYSNVGYPNIHFVKDALDELLYVSPAIVTLGINVQTQEIGSIVNSVRLTWSYNKAMVSANLTDVGPLNPALLSYDFNTPITSSKSWSLQASDGKNLVSRSVNLAFLRKRHWGISSSSSLSSGDILGLTGELASSRSQVRTINGDGKFIYFAYPLSWGGCSFKVNGLQSTAWVQSIVSHTNLSGNTTDYLVYRSSTIQTGSGIIIEVS